MAEWDSLLNCCTGNGTEGSNPSLSARLASTGIAGLCKALKMLGCIEDSVRKIPEFFSQFNLFKVPLHHEKSTGCSAVR